MCIRDRSKGEKSFFHFSFFMFITPFQVKSIAFLAFLVGITQSIMSVSYTHLDVYKRQAHQFIESFLINSVQRSFAIHVREEKEQNRANRYREKPIKSFIVVHIFFIKFLTKKNSVKYQIVNFLFW